MPKLLLFLLALGGIVCFVFATLWLAHSPYKDKSAAKRAAEGTKSWLAYMAALFGIGFVLFLLGLAG